MASFTSFLEDVGVGSDVTSALSNVGDILIGGSSILGEDDPFFQATVKGESFQGALADASLLPEGPPPLIPGTPNLITIPDRDDVGTNIVPIPSQSERQAVSTEAIRKIIPSLKQFEATTGRNVSSQIIEGIARGALTVASNRAAQDFALELQARGINANQAFRLAQQEIDVQVQNEQFRVQREGIAAGVAIESAGARAQGASALGSGLGAIAGFAFGGPEGAFVGSQAGGVLGGLFL